MSINRVFITGNLTRDAELRSTQSGLAVLKLGVAVNDRHKNPETGNWEDYANYIDCTMFGTRAQSIAGYLTRGTKVSIEGKLRWSQWETEGQKRSKIEVIIDDLDFGSSRNGGDQRTSGNYIPQNQNAYAYSSAPAVAPTAAPAPFTSASAAPVSAEPVSAEPAPVDSASADEVCDPAAPVIDSNSSIYDDEIPF